MKRILVSTFMISLTLGLNYSSGARAESDLPDFEAELRALETNNLKTEELQMRNVDAVTDVISDDVSTGQAGLEKKSATDTDTDETIMMTKKQKERFRRIRSR